jgi:putative membrane protein
MIRSLRPRPPREKGPLSRGPSSSAAIFFPSRYTGQHGACQLRKPFEPRKSAGFRYLRVLRESNGSLGPRSRSPAVVARRREPAILLVLTAILLALSGIGPKDRYTWFLEVGPILVAIPILVLTARRFPLTPLAYRLIALHAVVLMVGGHYTYAEVPLGFWVRDLFGFARNHYDRLGHFLQGFVPAILVREVLRRKTPLPPGGWLFFLTTSVCLAISAAYEFIEWGTALLSGSAAMAFLGTQGDVWDTQWDMFLALIGALTAQLLLSRVHERQLAGLPDLAPPL